MQTSNSHKVKLQGKVIENYRGDVIPECFVRLQTDQNTAVTVVYHSEFPPALNYHAGDVGYHLREGDQVEIYADVLDNERFSTCERNEYYIRKLS